MCWKRAQTLLPSHTHFEHAQVSWNRLVRSRSSANAGWLGQWVTDHLEGALTALACLLSFKDLKLHLQEAFLD